MPRGWDPSALPIVPLDGKTWTIAEAVKVLDLNPKQGMTLRNTIQHTHVFPVGRRRSTVPAKPIGTGRYDSTGIQKNGRLAKVYRADDLIELVELLGLNGPRYLASEPSPSDATA